MPFFFWDGDNFVDLLERVGPGDLQGFGDIKGQFAGS